MTDKKSSSDNFDKEFRMNSNKKTAVRGKIPAWIMILAGVAVMAAVVVVKQPFVRPSEPGTRASLTLQGSGSGVSGQTAGYSGMNDSQADPSELEARFGEQSGTEVDIEIPIVWAGSDQPYSMELKELATDKKGRIIPYESETEDSTVYWLEDTPYEVVVKPAEEGKNKGKTEDQTSSVTINGQEYNVSLKAMSQEDIAALPKEKQSELIHIGEETYMIELGQDTNDGGTAAPVETEAAGSERASEPAADIVPDEDPFEEKTESVPDGPVVAWLNEKPYAVTVKLYEEPAAGTDSEAADGSQKAYFEADDEMYEVSLQEMDPKDAEGTSTDAPVVWIDKTPLNLVLNGGDGSSEGLEVVLAPVPEEELPVLMKDRFGIEPAATETAEPVSEAEPVATEEPRSENWFTGVFHSIFGGGPTPEPTPQVTVIAVTPTPAPKMPTATSIVVRMAPTSTPQSPVRLDGDGQMVSSGNTAKTIEPKSGDLDDPALWDPSSPTAAPTRRSSGDTGSRVTSTPNADKPSGVTHPDVIILEPSDNDGAPVQKTVQPTPEELPHTGGADSWNIPSMLAMLAGLLLVIIGVRRLRTSRR